MNLEVEYEKRFGAFPISNITYYLIGLQVIGYLFFLANPNNLNAMILRGDAVFAGDWWRVFTFMAKPLLLSPIWVVLEWYFMYLIGQALENEWGSYNYVAYLIIVYVATIIGAILFPQTAFYNGFLFSSLFLAFAYLNPNFTLLLFFIIPIKIKWIAYLMWISLARTLVTGDLALKSMVILSVTNFIIFFGQSIYLEVLDRVRHGAFVLKHTGEQMKTYMRCSVCHKTEKDRKIFYYCHTCIPEVCYCEDHIKSHTHRVVN